MNKDATIPRLFKTVTAADSFLKSVVSDNKCFIKKLKYLLVHYFVSNFKADNGERPCEAFMPRVPASRQAWLHDCVLPGRVSL